MCSRQNTLSSSLNPAPFEKNKNKNKTLLESLRQIAGKVYEGKRKKEISKALALIAIGGMAGWKYGLEILFDLR